MPNQQPLLPNQLHQAQVNRLSQVNQHLLGSHQLLRLMMLVTEMSTAMKPASSLTLTAAFITTFVLMVNGRGSSVQGAISLTWLLLTAEMKTSPVIQIPTPLKSGMTDTSISFIQSWNLLDVIFRLARGNGGICGGWDVCWLGQLHSYLEMLWKWRNSGAKDVWISASNACLWHPPKRMRPALQRIRVSSTLSLISSNKVLNFWSNSVITILTPESLFQHELYYQFLLFTRMKHIVRKLKMNISRSI